MMAQKLMSENKDNPFNSRFFQPSDAMVAPTRQGFSNLLSRMEQKDKQGTDVFPALAIGSGFAPSAGISDVLGFAPDPFNPGQTLPSFSENIDQGRFLDAGLQTLGAGGDVMLAAAPFAPVLLAPAAAMKATSQLGKALRGGSNATDNSILQQLKTLRSDLKNANTQAEKLKIEEQITALKGQREQQLSDLRKQANIERFGYDPNDPSTLPDTSYRIQHQARGPKDDTPVRLDDLTKSTTGESAGFPDDFYTPRGQSIYAQGPRFSDDQYGLANIESYNIIKSVRGKPDAEVTIYRGVPDEESIKSINPGDFVTLSKKYAELHAGSGYGQSGKEAGKILSQKVKVKEIRSDGNDLNEFGYFPESN